MYPTNNIHLILLETQLNRKRIKAVKESLRMKIRSQSQKGICCALISAIKLIIIILDHQQRLLDVKQVFLLMTLFHPLLICNNYYSKAN